VGGGTRVEGEVSKFQGFKDLETPKLIVIGEIYRAAVS
jgi:hypothetical protein